MPQTARKSSLSTIQPADHDLENISQKNLNLSNIVTKEIKGPLSSRNNHKSSKQDESSIGNKLT